MRDEHISDVPLAVLLKIGQPEELITLKELPPPRTISRARPMSTTCVNPADPPDPTQRNWTEVVFELTGFEAPSYKWWHVYNDGRSRTPKPAFVYMERKA